MRVFRLLLLVLFLAGCGEPPAAPDAVTPDGPLASWRLIRSDGPLRGTGATIQAHARCRIRFDQVLEDGTRLGSTSHTLGPGETVGIWWFAEELEPLETGAPESMARAGRTTRQRAGLAFGLFPGAARHDELAEWTRPAHGRAHAVATVPPAAYEPLPAEFELLAIAVTDWRHGDARLRLRLPRAILMGAGEPDPEDRASLNRLLLVVEPDPAAP